MNITKDLSFLDKCYEGSFVEVCRYTSKELLSEYFQKRLGAFAINATSECLESYIVAITSAVKALPTQEQRKILLDCYIASFFVNSVYQNKDMPLNSVDKNSFTFLLRYLKKISGKNIDLKILNKLSEFDKIIYFLIYYEQEVYYCYSLHAYLKYHNRMIPIVNNIFIQDWL